jgi:hypothetical protein
VSGEPAAELVDVDGLLAAVIVEVAGRALTGRDLVAAGVVSGRWQRLENELSEGLGLVAALPPPQDEVTEAVRVFRFERGLLSAEDLRAWMQPRGLTIRAINAVAARAVARRHGGAPHRVPTAQLAAAVTAEAICTGVLRELGWWLADRLLSAKAADATVDPIALERSRVQRLVFAEARTVAGSRSRESGVERGSRLAWLAALDDAHRAWEASITGSEETARRLREHALDWCRFELDVLHLASAGAAAEAARQLAEGIGPHEVAAAAGVPLASQQVVLADAPSQLAQRLAGAVVGSVAGPWEDGTELAVVRVRERRAPDGGDEELLARARDELAAEAAERLRAGKVVWHEHA